LNSTKVSPVLKAIFSCRASSTAACLLLDAVSGGRLILPMELGFDAKRIFHYTERHLSEPILMGIPSQ
jgi:hypothetical protein